MLAQSFIVGDEVSGVTEASVTSFGMGVSLSLLGMVSKQEEEEVVGLVSC